MRFDNEDWMRRVLRGTYGERGYRITATGDIDVLTHETAASPCRRWERLGTIGDQVTIRSIARMERELQRVFG